LLPRSSNPTSCRAPKWWGETDSAVSWRGAFAVYGGHGTTASSTIVYGVEPVKRIRWHTDATEETQYIIAGTGGDFIFIAGMQGIDPATNKLVEDPQARIRQALLNIKMIAASEGASLKDA
jgi:enamine deaminase RidA (YjgF/YER057c/UK114 family)